MDWDLAIKRNSEALNSIVAALFAMLGLVGEATLTRLPRAVHSAVLRVLRPAESAVRRLIVIAARGLVVELVPSRTMPKGIIIGKGSGPSRPSFQLFDPRKRVAPLRVRKFTRLVPRIHFFGPDPRVVALWPAPRPVVVPPPPPDGLVSAARLTRRLQAKRLARWQLRRKNAPSHRFLSPLRPGHPPGYRRKPIHEVDEVLAECDSLAWEAMKPDTS